MIVCINPSTGGTYAEFNQSYAPGDAVACTQLVWSTPRPARSSLGLMPL